MPLPTQTWRISPLYDVTVAGTITATGIFTAIKAMFDAEDVIGNNYWTYSLYDNTATSFHMIFKRKGTPSGELATFRACLFFNNAGTINAANLGFAAQAAAATNIYAATSVTHNAETVTNQCDAGAVMGGNFATGQSAFVGSTLTTATAPKVFIVECDTMCSIWLTTSASANNARCVTFGQICERAKDGVGLWGHLSNGGNTYLNGIQDGSEPVGTGSPIGNIGNASTAGHGAGSIWDGASKQFGRTILPTAANVLDTLQNSTNDMAVIYPVLMGVKGAAGDDPRALGVLRQMRVTIRNTGRQELRDGSNVLQGYMVNAGFSALGRGIFYDQTA